MVNYKLKIEMPLLNMDTHANIRKEKFYDLAKNKTYVQS
jgi:hypothetical protein